MMGKRDEGNEKGKQSARRTRGNVKFHTFYTYHNRSIQCLLIKLLLSVLSGVPPVPSRAAEMRCCGMHISFYNDLIPLGAPSKVISFPSSFVHNCAGVRVNCLIRRTTVVQQTLERPIVVRIKLNISPCSACRFFAFFIPFIPFCHHMVFLLVPQHFQVLHNSNG